MATANGKCCDGDARSSGDGSVGSAHQSVTPLPRPPEFNACFSSPSPSPSLSSATPGSATAAASPSPSPVPARPKMKMRWGLWSPRDKSWMQLVQENYEKHHRTPRPPAVAQGGGCSSPRADDGGGPPSTPFVIHHIWLGSPLPEPLARLRESWLCRHSSRQGQASAGPSREESGGDGGGGWEARLWTDADVEEFGLENKEAYEAAGNFGQKSDILRYEILLRHGGVYVDADFLCLASFEDLHTRYDFYTGLSNTGTFELNNGLVGCRAGHPIMRDIVDRIRDTCTPPRRSPAPSASSSSPAAAAAAEGGGTGAGCNGRSGGGPVVVGDPLSALVGALGGGGGATGAGAGAGEGGGLLAGLLGGEDRARLEQAVAVEAGSATETIVKTGPGVFTRAVMAWMTASAAREGGTAVATSGRPEEGVLGRAAATGTAVRREKESPAVPTSLSGCSDGNGGDGGGSPGAGGTSTASPPLCRESRGAAGPAAAAAAPPPPMGRGVLMILPPSYLYPIPNNAVAAKEGSLIGDGMESGVRERAGGFFSAETLAAHLWGRSWQGKNGEPAS